MRRRRGSLGWWAEGRGLAQWAELPGLRAQLGSVRGAPSVRVRVGGALGVGLAAAVLRLVLLVVRLVLVLLQTRGGKKHKQLG